MDNTPGHFGEVFRDEKKSYRPAADNEGKSPPMGIFGIIEGSYQRFTPLPPNSGNLV